MNAVDLIRHEVTDLPEAQRDEVAGLHRLFEDPSSEQPGTRCSSRPTERTGRFFAPYRKDLSAFVFDREHANAR